MSKMSGPLVITPGNNTANTNAVYFATGDKTNPTVRMKIKGAANGGATFIPTITNASFGQASTLTIPDPGAATASFVMSSGTNASATFTAATITTATITTGNITKISTGATPVPMVDIAGTTITPAAGAANVCNVTIQFKDGAGTNLARVIPYTVYLSDSATGAGVTATSASGTVTHTTGTDIVALTAKKVIKAVSASAGQAVLAITDSVKTGFYVVVIAEGQGQKISPQLVTGNYG